MMAEPVSDPYKLEWRPIDDRAPVGVPVFVYWPRMALDDDGEPTGEVLEDDGHITLTMRHSVSAGWEPDNIVEANGAYFDDDFEFGEPTHWAPRPPRPQPLSNPQQLPEAPKVERRLQWHRLGDGLPEPEPILIAYKKEGEGFWRVRDAIMHRRYEGVFPHTSDLANGAFAKDWWFDCIYPGKGDCRLAHEDLLWAYMPTPDDHLAIEVRR